MNVKNLLLRTIEWMMAAWQQVKVKSCNAAVNRDNVAVDGLKVKGETDSSYPITLSHGRH